MAKAKTNGATAREDGATREVDGLRFRMQRVAFWKPWDGESGASHPNPIVGSIVAMGMTPASKTMGAQMTVDVESRDGAGTYRVGCNASIIRQLATVDDEGAFVAWKNGVEVGAVILVEYTGEGKKSKGKNASHLCSVGIAE